jgi:DNA-binding MarR family transcriptional regulator
MEKQSTPKLTAAGDAFTRLILEGFRFNGMILAAGDRLTKELGLTSALWQVMGAIQDRPLSMAQIGRNMGLARQSVRRSVGVLMAKGMVEQLDNPDHQRAKLIALTKEGRRALDEVTRRYHTWANAMAKGCDQKLLTKAARTMQALADKL